MKYSTSQIQKKVIIIIVLALVSIITKAQSQTDYAEIALEETKESNNAVENKKETFVVNVSLTAATGKVLEIGKKYIMENNNTATETSTNLVADNSTEIKEMNEGTFLSALNSAIEETKRAKIANTYLRLIQK